MKQIEKYKKISIIINKAKKSLSIVGGVGVSNKNFSGGGLLFFNKKLFFLTKGGYRTFLKLLSNFYVGVTYGYHIEINFIGLGYRFLQLRNFLLLKLGYSHYVKYIIPETLRIVGYKRQLVIFGMNNIEVITMAKQLRLFKKPTIYKGKGIQIKGEVLKFKIGKQK